MATFQLEETTWHEGGRIEDKTTQYFEPLIIYKRFFKEGKPHLQQSSMRQIGRDFESVAGMSSTLRYGLLTHHNLKASIGIIFDPTLEGIKQNYSLSEYELQKAQTTTLERYFEIESSTNMFFDILDIVTKNQLINKIVSLLH